MRAKFIYENLNKFTRGQDPKAAMSVGNKAKIIKWFSDLEIKSDKYEIDDKLNITVKEDLNLSSSYITELPDNLTINGNLDLSYSKVLKLSDNLKVDGWLDLSYTNITELPNNLIVNDYLFLYDTNITELPKNLDVKTKIYGFKK